MFQTKPVLVLNKPIGVTPLQTIDRFREQNPDYHNHTLSYAGRLDPMAEGLLLVLVDEQNRQRRFYEYLPKQYEFDILFGVSTDTYDRMGLITSVDLGQQLPKDILTKVRQYTPSLIGTHNQPYPPFSSARVNGKPLYYWARQNKLAAITIPTKQMTITDISVQELTTRPLNDLITDFISSIETVTGEFRQKEIITDWRAVAKTYRAQPAPMITCRIMCSSGTYVRGIANQIGSAIGQPTIAARIKRTSVGPYTLADAFVT